MNPPSPLSMLLSRHTRRRAFITGLGSAAVWPGTPVAQVSRPLIVYFGIASAQESAPMVRTLLQGLRELGYREGQDYDIVYRFADGDWQEFRHWPKMCLLSNRT